MNNENKSNGIANLVSALQDAKKGIAKSKIILKGKPKSAENYLITQSGVIAETDRSIGKGEVIVGE